MADYQIVCAERLSPHHGHITHVGTGYDNEADQRWTTEAVRQALEDGDSFYTVSSSTDHVADVEAYDANVSGTTIETIRSSPDAIWDNNLDNLRACRFVSS